MKLVAKVEEKAGGLARETAGAGEGKVGCDQEVVDGVIVDLAGDGQVVAGGASVAEDGSLVGGGPQETEDSSVKRRVGCSQVVEGQVVLGVGEHFSQVERRVGGVADSDNRAMDKLCGREEVVVRWWWVFRGAKRANVDNRALKSSFGTLLHHFIGGVREDLRDAAGSAPGDNMVGASSGALELGMGGRDINFYSIV